MSLSQAERGAWIGVGVRVDRTWRRGARSGDGADGRTVLDDALAAKAKTSTVR